MVGGLKFSYEERRRILLCSENKGTAQLHDYRAADLHLCFCIMQKAGFLMTWLIGNTKVWVSLHITTCFVLGYVDIENTR